MLEEEIKNEFDSYEIKTKSSDILARMNTPKRKFNKAFIFAPLASACCCVALVAGVILNRPQKNNSSKGINVSLSAVDFQSQMAVELLYAGQMHEGAKNSLMSNVTYDDFTFAVDKIEESYQMLDVMNKGNVDIVKENVNFSYDDSCYKYSYTINEYVIYANDDLYNVDIEDDEYEFEQDILVKLDGIIYYGSFSVEIEDDEYELELLYKTENGSVKIKREVEEDESKYSYKVKKNGEDLYEKKISFDDEDGQKEFKYKYESSLDDVKEELVIKIKEDLYKISYKYESADTDINTDKIELKIENGVRIYTLLDMTYSI